MSNSKEAKNINGATNAANTTVEPSTNAKLPRTPIALNENRYASPADILHAMLASGWYCFELRASASAIENSSGVKSIDTTSTPNITVANKNLLILNKKGFEFVINPETINWYTVLLAWQEYGAFEVKEQLRLSGIDTKATNESSSTNKLDMFIERVH